MQPRRSHPYRDTDVIDARAPRFNQATIGVLALVAFLTGFWPILALLAAQLLIGLRFGRRYCLPCVVYFELVQPRLGEGPIEDSRPPRFANQLGAAVLSAATIAHLLGLSAIGWGLGLLVAVLALLAATTGLCVGCEMYRVSARLRGIRSGRLERIALTDLAAVPDGEAVVEFTHPLCTDCASLATRLEAEGRQVIGIDVRSRPDLARKYGVALVPTAVVIGPSGMVTGRLT